MLQLKNTGPVISFTFDDFPSSAMNASKLLTGSGFAGTFYASMSKMNKPGFFTADQLEWLISRGHEIGCHTYSHKSLRFCSGEVIKSEFNQNQKTISALFPEYKFQNFAYPFGILPLFGGSQITQSFTTARGISHGINHGKIKSHKLKAVKLYENLHSPEMIQKFLNKAGELNGWIIFYTHGVDKNYDKYSCSPEYFNKILDLSINTGYDILSVAEVVNSKLL